MQELAGITEANQRYLGKERFTVATYNGKVVAVTDRGWFAGKAVGSHIDIRNFIDYCVKEKSKKFGAKYDVEEFKTLPPEHKAMLSASKKKYDAWEKLSGKDRF